MTSKTPLTSQQAKIALTALSKQYQLTFPKDTAEELLHCIANFKMEKVNTLIGDTILNSEIIIFLICIGTANQQAVVPISKVICNFKLDIVDINSEMIRRRNWIIAEINKESFKDTLDLPLYIGTSLWVCNCKTEFVKTNFHKKCNKCGTLQTKPNTQYAPLPNLFKEKSN